jgi:hypothetical protein
MKGFSQSQTQGASKSVTQGTNQSVTQGTNQSVTQGTNQSVTQGTNQSHSTGRSESDGTSSSVGGGESGSRGSSEGQAHASGHTEGESESTSQGSSHTVSHKKVHLARQREEWHPTGKLAMAVGDQFHRMMQQIHGLPTRCAVVKIVDTPQAFAIQVDEVSEPFATQKAKMHVIEVTKRKLYETHPYFFAPTFGRDEQDRRIDEFLGARESQIEETVREPGREGLGSASRENFG